jgi:hypothetical protein
VRQGPTSHFTTARTKDDNDDTIEIPVIEILGRIFIEIPVIEITLQADFSKGDNSDDLSS